MGRREVLWAVSLDIGYACNTLPRSTLLEVLGFHRESEYLRKMVESYVSDRAIVYMTHKGVGRRGYRASVPQGLVHAPLLWNIEYDWVPKRSRRGLLR